MQINTQIIGNFRDFIQLNVSINEAQQKLKDYRNITISDFDLKNSRCLWMSLILYKFKSEMEVSDELWTLSRQMIISVLKSDENVKEIMNEYLRCFTEWQNEDLNNILLQFASNYYNILQIKKSIENTKNEESIKHWIPHYQNIIDKIRNYCIHFNILDKLDSMMITFEEKKYNIVKEIMNRAYWNKIEEDIEKGDNEIVFNNLTELKIMLFEILPKNTKNNIDEIIDINYMKHLVEKNLLDKEYLLKLYIFVINLLKEWDADAFVDKYNEELDEYKKKEETYTMSQSIRYILEKLMTLTIDLKNRKALWKIILKKNNI